MIVRVDEQAPIEVLFLRFKGNKNGISTKK